MACTVKQLAKISGVSVRTLHFYDEIGLLKPAYIGNNKYRYYEEEQLLMLQQILFFRELGFSLDDVKRMIKRSDFDKVTALISHREILEKNLDQTQQLIKTIDKTIAHLRGNTPMRNEELFIGFDAKQQKEYKTYLLNRLGDKISPIINLTEEKTKTWSKEDWDNFHNEWDDICKELAQLFKQSFKEDSPEVQNVIRRHYQWLPWKEVCTKEAYIGLGQSYTEFAWQKAFSPYDSNHPSLAAFMANAMKIFAEKELA